MPAPLVLVLGATGFVGRHLIPCLVAAGYRVRLASRRPIAASTLPANCEAVHCELLASPVELRPAFADVDLVYYLAHAVGDTNDYPRVEAKAARHTVEAAEQAGVRRLVYLGGVRPWGQPSQHLQSRLDTGLILRSGRLETIELRASMIIGAGSASFRFLHDITRRVPWLLLPRWMSHRSAPIAIEDAVYALLLCASCPSTNPGIFALAGPELLSHRALLERLAAYYGKKVWQASSLTLAPEVLGWALGALTLVPSALVRELVAGLAHDLSPAGLDFFSELGLAPTRDLESALLDAITDLNEPSNPGPALRHRLSALGRRLAVPT